MPSQPTFLRLNFYAIPTAWKLIKDNPCRIEQIFSESDCLEVDNGQPGLKKRQDGVVRALCLLPLPRLVDMPPSTIANNNNMLTIQTNGVLSTASRVTAARRGHVRRGRFVGGGPSIASVSSHRSHIRFAHEQLGCLRRGRRRQRQK